MITLTILTGIEAGRTVTLDTERLVIGRGSACDIVLQDHSVSRRHCTIQRQGDDFVVTDLQSANHTFLNNDLTTPITSQILQTKDELSLGKTRLRIELPEHEALSAVRQPEVPIVITVVSGPDRGQVYSPAQNVISLGQANTSDIVLHDSQVSRLHASIKREGGRYRVYDENSINGTYVGAPLERIFHTDLSDGATLILGQTQLRVELSAESPHQTRQAERARQAGQVEQTGEEPADDVTSISGTVRDNIFTFVLPGLDPRSRHQHEEDTGPIVLEDTPLAPTRENLAQAEAVSVEQRAKEDVRSQSEAFKDRLSVITQKGVTLKPFTMPGSARHWATLVIMLLATVGSYGFLSFGHPQLYSSGPVSSDHMELESQCVTCHPAWGRQSINTTCGQTDCHANVLTANVLTASAPTTVGLKADVPVQDDCIGCHTEHRGREFAINSGATQCWGCHQTGSGVRAFHTRPLRTYYEQVFVASGHAIRTHSDNLTYEQIFVASGYAIRTPSDNLTPVHVQSAAIAKSQRAWLQGRSPQKSGLIFGHAAHAEAVEDEDISCSDCHTGQASGSMNLPTYATCIDCHDEVGDSDPQRAKANASDECLVCHTKQDGEIVRVQRTISFVHFRHLDHQDPSCENCHFVTQDEEDYQPVVRSAELYPVPMEECVACHEQQEATLACLDCHREHHTAPATTKIAGGWLSMLTLEGVLIVCVALVAGAGTYTYFDTRLARQWLTALTQPTAGEATSELAADAATTGVPPPTPERKLLFSAALGFSDQLDAEEFPSGLQQLFETQPIALSENIVVAVQTKSSQWLITDKGNGQSYFVKREDDQLAMYEESKILPYPIVDLDRCIACHGCYDSCPAQVLAGDPITSKSVVIDPHVCTAHEDGCTICQEGCPTDAIRITTTPVAKAVERPQIDAHQESTIPGLFFAGEIVGAALIKKAINQGDQVVRHIHNHKPRLADAAYDVIIVGSGPAGLGAALEAKRLGLRYLLLERGTLASTIRDYPRDKAVLAEPVSLPLYGLLPMRDLQKEDLVATWEQVVQEQGIHINEQEEATDVQKINDVFTVRTLKDTYHSANVILAIGMRGTLRKLDVPGEDLPKVAYSLVNAADFQGKRVLVVGGGDGAVEAAVAVSKETGTTVHLSYRKGEFSRIKSRNTEALTKQEKAGRITLVLHSHVKQITQTSVVLQSDDGLQTLENDAVFVLIGADPPKAWLEEMGITIVTVQETAGTEW